MFPSLATGAQIFYQLISPIFLMLAAGYLLEKRFNLDLRTLSRISLYLFVPCLAFSKIYGSDVPLPLLGIASGFTAALVLASLGLGWGIARLLGQGTVQESAQAMLAATLAAGARDNVTIVVIEAG